MSRHNDYDLRRVPKTTTVTADVVKAVRLKQKD